MSKVNDLVSIMHQFTPKGQDMLLKILKENKSTLKKDFGFVKIPKIISDKGMTDKFEKELLDKNSSIRDVVNNLLDKISRIAYGRRIFFGTKVENVQDEIIEMGQKAESVE